MSPQFQQSPASLQQVLDLARDLPPVEKLRLIETLALELETALQQASEKLFSYPGKLLSWNHQARI